MFNYIMRGDIDVSKIWKKHAKKVKTIGVNKRITKETINDKISNITMLATANAAEEEFTKEHSRNSKRESSALDDEEHDSSNDEEIAVAQVEHGFENVRSRASISCDS
ncbi:hypothetical protein BC936DRAFT_139036, partial [Jimgerdemannia flammicorona]